ncbi:MAG: hypothetical protein L0Z50_30700 [Verrucomicrobiales bacterium]|nr:hypothetical protein [Verrucomicrobiales bacterium]
MNSFNSNDMPGRAGHSAGTCSGFIDPRWEKDFSPSLYPKADGALAPSPESGDRDDRIKVEFCAVYYRLNLLHAQLTEMRKNAGDSDGDRRACDLMGEIEKHLRLRDELEDRYAPYGVIAEAIAKDGFTVEIKFTFGDRTVLREQRTRLISSTALIFFGPDDPSI